MNSGLTRSRLLSGRRWLGALTLAMCSLVVLTPAGAAAYHAPPNDSFYSATNISTLPFEDAYVSNWGATLDYEEFDPSCSEVNKTVWYKVVPTSNYTLRVRVIPDYYDYLDAVVAVYDGTSYDTLSERACADESAYSDESVALPVYAGHTYYIQVGGYFWHDTWGEFSVRVRREPTRPANDSFANSTQAALGSVYNATTSQATRQAGEPPASCGVIGKTVWYKLRPATTRTVVATTAGSNFDTMLAVYRGGSLGTLSQVACNDDAGTGVSSRVRLTLQGGTTYYFQAGGYNDASGALTFRVKRP